MKRSLMIVRGGAQDATPKKASRFQAYVAMGSNLGDRSEAYHQALQRLNGSSTRVARTSHLYQTDPMYVTDQPAFWNSVVQLDTDLPPHDLLKHLKTIEEDLGRDFGGIRNGPRPMDLDILMVQDIKEGVIAMETDDLIIPHPRINEREFVLKPLSDLCNDPIDGKSASQMLESLTDRNAVRIIPLPRNRCLVCNRTLIMGILNVTPDSFSDGNQDTVQQSVQRALSMVGADIIDVGGESTRPGADILSVEEELQRTIPVIRGIREHSDVPISIDTRRSIVARKAIGAGADIVNDVSGGTFDENMLATVSELGVPIVLMHMRGTPQTMQTMTAYEDGVVESVSNSLQQLCDAASEHNIPLWLQIADPGIGFAKSLEGNLDLLRHLSQLRPSGLPLLLGTSRKGFLGKLTGISTAADRDVASVASCVAALCLDVPSQGPNILRVHNVEKFAEAIKVMDAIKYQP